MITKLNELNSFEVISVFDEKFKYYGKVLDNVDAPYLEKVMHEDTLIPEEGNLYVAGEPKLEDAGVMLSISSNFYGGMPIQIGYCNGRNSTVNGFEYHKGSELIFAVSDFVLCLGNTWDIESNSYDVNKALFFYVKAGTWIELYQTTLHLSPLKVNDEGYKAVIVLPKNTNTKLECESDDRLLLMTNKWVIAHPQRVQLTSQGAHPGLIGENLELKY